jgi:hypothetical protein
MVVIVEEEQHCVGSKTVKHRCENTGNMSAAKLLLNVCLGGMGEKLWHPLSGSQYSLEENRIALADLNFVHLNPPLQLSPCLVMNFYNLEVFLKQCVEYLRCYGEIVNTIFALQVTL